MPRPAHQHETTRSSDQAHAQAKELSKKACLLIEMSLKKAYGNGEDPEKKKIQDFIDELKVIVDKKTDKPDEFLKAINTLLEKWESFVTPQVINYIDVAVAAVLLDKLPQAELPSKFEDANASKPEPAKLTLTTSEPDLDSERSEDIEIGGDSNLSQTNAYGKVLRKELDVTYDELLREMSKLLNNIISGEAKLSTFKSGTVNADEEDSRTKQEGAKRELYAMSGATLDAIGRVAGQEKPPSQSSMAEAFEEYDKYFDHPQRVQGQYRLTANHAPRTYNRRQRIHEGQKIMDDFKDRNVSGTMDPIIKELIEKRIVPTMKQLDPSKSEEARIRFIAVFASQIAETLPTVLEKDSKFLTNTFGDADKEKIAAIKKFSSEIKAIIDIPDRDERVKKAKEFNILNVLADNPDLCKGLQELYTQNEGAALQTLSLSAATSFFGDFREIAEGPVSAEHELPKSIQTLLNELAKKFEEEEGGKAPLYYRAELLKAINEELHKDNPEAKVKFFEKTLAEQFAEIVGAVNEKCKLTDVEQEKLVTDTMKSPRTNDATEAGPSHSPLTNSHQTSWSLMKVLRHSPFLIAGRGRRDKVVMENKYDDFGATAEPTKYVPDEHFVRGDRDSGHSLMPSHGYENTPARDVRNLMNTNSQIYAENSGLAFLAVTQQPDVQLGDPFVNGFLQENKGKDDFLLTKENVEQMVITAMEWAEKIKDEGSRDAQKENIKKDLGTVRKGGMVTLSKKANERLVGKKLNEDGVIDDLSKIGVKYMNVQYIDIANSFGYSYSSGASGHTGHILSLGLLTSGLLKEDAGSTAQAPRFTLTIDTKEDLQKYAALVTSICVGMEKSGHHTYEEVLAVVWLLQNANTGRQSIIKMEGKFAKELPKIDLADMKGSFKRVTTDAAKLAQSEIVVQDPVSTCAISEEAATEVEAITALDNNPDEFDNLLDTTCLYTEDLIRVTTEDLTDFARSLSEDSSASSIDVVESERVEVTPVGGGPSFTP